MNLVFAREVQKALKNMSELQKLRMKYVNKKIYIGNEKRDGWSGELPFYIFWCKACEHFTKDYPNGHIERQHLNCSNCGEYHDFVPWRIEWQMLLETVKFMFSHRRQS